MKEDSAGFNERSAVSRMVATEIKEEFLKTMLELNGTFLILIASFLAFIYLLDGVFVKPISKVMSARAAKIEKDLVESKGYRQEAEGVLSQYLKQDWLKSVKRLRSLSMMQ